MAAPFSKAPQSVKVKEDLMLCSAFIGKTNV